jgi:hypothetical protein
MSSSTVSSLSTPDCEEQSVTRATKWPERQLDAVWTPGWLDLVAGRKVKTAGLDENMDNSALPAGACPQTRRSLHDSL